ncbi:unnamed protein product [Calicophoron daubneyi]|uniref:Ubiquitin-like-conjugating enzyme ATG3 n=1 Tax=Calicophoron daubneyi TaxID=300641 RepID=A0AAV2TJ92_CALDB
MDSIRQAFTRTALGIAEYVVPVLKTSKFKETGVITPEEFVAAGDFLVHHCPTWQWASGDKPPRNYLPTDKQYLLTRNVPCYKRVYQVDNHNEEMEKVIDDDDLEGGWVDTHHYSASYSGDSEKPAEMVLPPGPKKTVDEARSLADGNDSDEDEEAEDMDAFIQRGMLDEIDPAAVTKRAQPPAVIDQSLSTSKGGVQMISGNAEILQTRTYDLYITYDKYYQTPRLWLYGYDEHRKPLTEAQMYEDFSQDHVKKTVTMEQHPHLSGPPMPSIHPCRQAEVMRKLIEAVAEGGAELAVHQYLMVFLKFVQAVIPTIEYDYTQNFNMS